MSVALVIQRAKRMRRIILSSVACPAVQHFLTLSINGTTVGKKLLNIKCVFWFSVQVLSKTCLILRRTQRDFIINAHRSACKVPVLHVRFWLNLNIPDRFSKNTHIKFHESLSSGSRVVPCGRSDMMKLIVAFRNVANAPKIAVSGDVSIVVVN